MCPRFRFACITGNDGQRAQRCRHQQGTKGFGFHNASPKCFPGQAFACIGSPSLGSCVLRFAATAYQIADQNTYTRGNADHNPWILVHITIGPDADAACFAGSGLEGVDSAVDVTPGSIANGLDYSVAGVWFFCVACIHGVFFCKSEIRFAGNRLAKQKPEAGGPAYCPASPCECSLSGMDGPGSVDLVWLMLSF